MSFTTTETDAQFFRMMHKLIQKQCPSERRGHQRDPFASTQRIAPVWDGSPPLDEDFFEVRCNDLTPRGFSFLMDSEPEFEELIIALAASPDTIFVHANIRHSRKVLFFPDSGRIENFDEPAVCGEYYESQQHPSTYEKGQLMLLVGCCFTARFN